jgi:hypothetical protein
MAAVTDLPFRTVCEEFGVGFTITEFLSAHALAVGDPKTTGKLTASLDGRRFGVQIFGREEAAMESAPARKTVRVTIYNQPYTLVATDYLNSYYGRLAVTHLDGRAPQRRLVAAEA